MSGIVRNLLTLISALVWTWTTRSRPATLSATTCHFCITPFDCGTRVLKSDRYLLLAEAAQLDFMIKTKLAGGLLRNGIGFVNAAQLIKFKAPVGIFRRVRVETAIVCTNTRFATFSHTVFLRDRRCAEILVKMKFKKGTITVPPADITGCVPSEKPAFIQAWDDALDALP